MASRTGTILQVQDRVRSLGFSLLALIACLTVGAWAGPSWAQGSQVTPDYNFYKGKTIDIMVANSAGTPMANFAASMKSALEKALGAQVRINYNTAPPVAALNAAVEQPADGLHLGVMAIGTTMGQAIFNNALSFDLRDLTWIGATYNDLTAVWACGPKPQWTTFEQFMSSKDPVITTGVQGGNSYLINIALLKGLGREFKMLTGYTSSTIGVSCTRGDGNFRVSTVGIYLNSAGTATVPGAHPLLISGKAPVGSPLKFLNDAAPTLADWLKTYQPKTPEQKQMLDLAVAMFATDSPNAAIFAPPKAPAERVAAVRGAFATAVKDPAVQETWLKLGLPPGQYFTGDQIEKSLKETFSDVPRIRLLLGIAPK